MFNCLETAGLGNIMIVTHYIQLLTPVCLRNHGEMLQVKYKS